jgi:GTP-binding protein EngB required for normal cell division
MGTPAVKSLRALCAQIQDTDIRDSLTQEVERLGSCIAAQAAPVNNRLITIAVAGSFSCGKSSFINSLLGEPLAPVDAPPLTHCITTFIHGPKELITDSAGRTVSRKKYQACVVDQKSRHTAFVVAYPCTLLKGFSVMDAPGFGAPETASAATAASSRDAQLSAKAVRESDVVLFLVNIRDGTLHDNSVRYLNEVSKELIDKEEIRKPVFFILTHADCTPPSNREAVRKKILDVIRQKQLDVDQVVIYSSCEGQQRESDKAYFAQRKQDVLGIIAHLAGKKKAMDEQRRRMYHQRATARLGECASRVFHILAAGTESLKRSVEAEEMGIRRRWKKASAKMVDAIFAVMSDKIAAIRCEEGSDFYDVAVDEGILFDDHIISIKESGNPMLLLTASEKATLRDSCGEFATSIGRDFILTVYDNHVTGFLDGWDTHDGCWESVADTMQEFTDQIREVFIAHEQVYRQDVARLFSRMADDTVRDFIEASQAVEDQAQLERIGACVQHGLTTGRWTTTTGRRHERS